MRRALILLFSGLAILLSCSDDSKDNHNNYRSNVAAKKSNFKLKIKGSNGKSVTGDIISISIHPDTEAIKWDSAQLFVDDILLGTVFPKENNFQWNSENSKVGYQMIEAIIYNDTAVEESKNEFLLNSNIKPTQYSFEVVNEYPHDPLAFTQGLLFMDDILYEGTGMKGSSEIRKVEVESGKIIKSTKLSSNLFGEGITIYNNNLYQLTWKAGLALVYNKDQFNEISKLYYQGDGWGLTNDTALLYLSDGSNIIKIIRPEDFSVQGEIQVYDQKGAIGFINELEMIDNHIYANVWQKDVIIIIDPKTGKVEGEINLSKLYPASKPKPGVLNGIAYDKKKDRLFVTGKYWPKLYEIKIKKKGTTSS